MASYLIERRLGAETTWPRGDTHLVFLQVQVQCRSEVIATSSGDSPSRLIRERISSKVKAALREASKRARACAALGGGVGFDQPGDLACEPGRARSLTISVPPAATRRAMVGEHGLGVRECGG